MRFRQGKRKGRDDPTRTLPEDTILDAASETTADGAIHLLARAITDGRATAARVLAVMAQRSRQVHRRAIEEACRHGMAGVESILEWRYSTEVEDAHGLPTPIRQSNLNHFTREDLLYPDYGVVVELDGRLGHGKYRDYRRDNRNVINHSVAT